MGKEAVLNNIPKMNSPAELWMQWHIDLKDYFGKKEANSIWRKAWSIRGSSSANQGFLRKHLKDNGITISTSTWDDVVDTGSDITDVFGDLFQISKYAGIALGVIFIAGTGMVIYNIAKDPISAAGAAVKLRTGGIK